jgi:Na+-translocating ferredoxin:NAD+ oxidoreductase RnfA subunit
LLESAGSNLPNIYNINTIYLAIQTLNIDIIHFILNSVGHNLNVLLINCLNNFPITRTLITNILLNAGNNQFILDAVNNHSNSIYTWLGIYINYLEINDPHLFNTITNHINNAKKANDALKAQLGFSTGATIINKYL